MRLLVILSLIIFSVFGEELSWNYIKNGEDWVGTCNTGQQQSPINIEDDKANCDNTLQMDLQLIDQNLTIYMTKKKNLESEGNFSNLYVTSINGQIYGYTATQFHIHQSSEHHIDGKEYDIELHIVHTLKDDFLLSNPTAKTKAVVSLLFSVDDTNTKATFFDKWNPDQANKTTNFTFNMKQALDGILDNNGSFYAYEGSLTTPPCDEIVNWYVFTQILPMTSNQLKQINGYFKGDLNFANGQGNNRMIQSLNDRTIKKGNTQCEEQFIYFFTFFIIYTFLNFFIFKML